MASLAKTEAVEFSKRSRVGGWACPRSARVVQMGMASWPLIKVAPILDLAAEAMALERRLERVKMGPLIGGFNRRGLTSIIGTITKEVISPSWLRALFLDN